MFSLDVFVQFDRELLFHFDSKPPSLDSIIGRLAESEQIAPHRLKLYQNGLEFTDNNEIFDTGILILSARIIDAVVGGKGGFGAALRHASKQKGPKPVTDFGACRDLSGRRLRHVNDEIILQKWQEAQDRGEEFNVDQQTPSGINLWFLPTPSWTEGFGKKTKNSYRKMMRKSKLCSDWVRAREGNRRIPANAPVWYGCPRGGRCEFAHVSATLLA